MSVGEQIDVIKNIDTINFIVQNCVKQLIGTELKPRNTAVVGDGYAVDIKVGNKNNYNLHIRTAYLQDLCRIQITPKSMFIRYTPKFCFYYTPKFDIYNTTLFTEQFSLDEMEAVFFTQNCLDGWGLQVNFDYDIMIETLKLCERMYNDFLISIKE